MTDPQKGAKGIDPRLAAYLAWWQFELNCLASVSIEVPALRPAFERMRDV